MFQFIHSNIHLNKVLQKFSTARPSSSVAKHKLLRDTDEDGRAVENFCNTLFKCINYNLHEEMFCFNVHSNIDTNLEYYLESDNFY